MYKVLYANRAPEAVYEIIRSQVPQGFQLLTLRTDSDEERRSLLGKADFLIVATVPIDEKTLHQAPRLKLIQHQGVGYDSTDVEAAARLSIPVALTPEGTTIGVAEHTLLLILAVYKKLVVAHRSLQSGKWLQFALRPDSYELAGKTLGLVGMGRIGKAVALRARAFDAQVIYADVAAAEAEGARQVELADLLQRSDIVSLHAPLTNETRGLIGAGELATMKKTAILINTARGPLVDEPALVEALRSGTIAGAGLDVFENEPPPENNPLFALENVVLTPHIAAGTRDALTEKMRAAFANILRVSRGEEPINRVN